MSRYESIDTLARPAVDLADQEGAPAAEEDPPGAEVVRAEVDECADGPLTPTASAMAVR